MTKQDTLNQIKASILKDKICPELAAQATQLVFGEGNPGAEVVFIGEAPGKSEDIQGKPFVGAAGKFLEEMLAMIGLKRQDVYITNIVKYRPPNNRDPFPDEKAAFLPYLEAQLEAIQPKLIVTLGRHSLNCFLPDLSISQVHGMPKRIRVKSIGQGVENTTGGPDAGGVQGSQEKRASRTDGTVSEASTQQSAAKLGSASGSARRQDELIWVILPLFHPAAALYNSSMKQTLIDDFAKIPVTLELINSSKK